MLSYGREYYTYPFPSLLFINNYILTGFNEST